jgi:hypothetical protein
LIEQIAARNSRRAGQLTRLGNLNIIIAGHAPLRRLCVSLIVGNTSMKYPGNWAFEV